MPPPKTSEQALYFYVSESLRKALNSLKADSRLKSANKAPRMTYRKLMRRMIEEVSASEKLETAIRSYFLDHNSRPADSNQTIKIRSVRTRRRWRSHPHSHFASAVLATYLKYAA